MRNLTPEEKARLNSIFGGAAFAVTNGDPELQRLEIPDYGELRDRIECCSYRADRSDGQKQPVMKNVDEAIRMAYDVLHECIEARTIDPIDAITEALDILEGVLSH